VAYLTLGGLEIGRAIRPADGFNAGGDAVVVEERGDAVLLAIVDVLGHGPDAHRVAIRIEETLIDSEIDDVRRLLSLLDQVLTGSLGAAVGVAIIEARTGRGRFSGIGNTVARVFGQAERQLLTIDGVVGQSHRGGPLVDFVLGVGEVLVLHTDGIRSRLALADYPQLRAEDVEIAAGELIRRFGKSYDDAACIVARRVE
jgi:hypothetical protein